MIRSFFSSKLFRFASSILVLAVLLAPPAHADDDEPAQEQSGQRPPEDINDDRVVDPMRIGRSSWGAPRPTYEGPLAYDLFDRPGHFMVRARAKPRYRDNLKLDGSDESKISLSLELRNEYDPTDWLKLMAGIKFLQNSGLDVEDDEEESEGDIQRGLLWAYAHNIAGTGLGLQVGRQKFRDSREWWWDERLDAIRAEWVPNEKFLLEVAVAEEQFKIALDEDHMDAELEDIFRVLVHAQWVWQRRQMLEFYFLSHDDHSDTPPVNAIVSPENEDEDDADLRWVGLRSTGRYKINSDHRLYYWLDTAYVWGDETVLDFGTERVAGVPTGNREVDSVYSQDVSAWAVDLGTTWETRWRAEPRFTFGFAMGSGDSDPREDAPGTSSSFRQTGINDNNGKWRGENRFRYYGELLRPELSNLQITTFAVGFPVLESSSVEFIHHYYRQVHKAQFLRSARIDPPDIPGTDPGIKLAGTDPDIGHELDLSLGLEEWKYFKAEFTAGMFRAGEAYGSDEGDLAFIVSLSLSVEF